MPDIPASEPAPATGPVPPHRPTHAAEETLPSSPTDSLLGTQVGSAASETRAGASAPQPPSSPAPADATSRLGRYEIRRELGRGATGTVCLAFDPGLRREVALKILHPTGIAGGEALDRFRREAEAAARLSHPRIVTVYDVGEADGVSYLAMELVPGGSVAGRLAQAGRLPTPEALRLVREAAEGVAFAHARGVVHRDLKPENLLLDAEGRVKVADFGLAMLAAAPGSERLTSEGQVLGTPSHMAPEQAEGDSATVDARGDVYSLGSILYELVTGRAPYSGGGALEVVFRKLAQDPEPPRRVRPDLAPDVETIIQRAMERERDRRYAGAQDLADDLGRFLAGEVIRARPVGRAERAVRWVRGHRAASAAAAAAVVLLSLAGAWAWREDARRRAALAGAAAAEARAGQAREAMLRQLRGLSAVSLEAALELRRAGVLVPQRTGFVAHLRAAFAEAKREAPDLVEPHYHMGRMERALMHDAAALAHQEEALALDPGFAPSLYERAVLAAKRHRESAHAAWVRAVQGQGARLHESGLLRSGGAGGVEVSLPTVAQLAGADPDAEKWRAVTEDSLRRLEEALARGTAGGPGLEPARLETARGLVALQSPGGGAEGQRRLEAALALDPSIEEAYEGLYRIAGAEGRHADALAVLDRGIAADRGYLPFHLQRGNHHLGLADAAGRNDRDSGENQSAAVEDFTAALAIDPDSWEAHFGRGVARMNLGVRRIRAQQSPDELYHAALEDFDAAATRAPEPATVWKHSAGLRLNWATMRSQRGENVAGLFEQAVASFTRVAELRPADEQPWLGRGLARANWAAMLIERRTPVPQELFAAAENDFAESLRRNPLESYTWRFRGFLRISRGLERDREARSPESLYAEAAADLERAAQLEPTAVTTRIEAGQAHQKRGEWRLQRAEDPSAAFAEAEACFAQAMAADPKHADAPRRRGMVRMNLGIWALWTGGEALAPYEGAIGDLERAAALDPADAQVPAWLASARNAANEVRRIAPDRRWRRLLPLVEAEIRDGKLLAAWRVIGFALDAVPAGPPAEADRPALIALRYHRARLCARASVGRVDPCKDVAAPTPEEAARLRGEAIDQLERAMELGFRDRAPLDGDPELAPLREDPRWPALLERLAR